MPVHVLHLLDHALGAHLQHRQALEDAALAPEGNQATVRRLDSSLAPKGNQATVHPPDSTAHSRNGRANRRERFSPVKRFDIDFLLLWLTDHTDCVSSRPKGPTYQATDAVELEA